ncbi:nucleotidyltransferase family protein [Zunongwangia sp. H14]|uniref:nucleotidyltransferase family protein n=1 Tax=Zunongwangia sp. H14 TaxID=3240792 RepID=UPI0035692218
MANARLAIVQNELNEIFNYFWFMKIDEKNINRIKKLCKKYKVRTFSAFGSVTREDFSSDSDIDFVVDFEENDPFIYTDLYFQLKEKLEKLLKRQIDLIEERGIKNQYFKKELDNTKILIYGQQN